MTIQPNTYPATNNIDVHIPNTDKIIVLYFYPKDATPGCTQEGLDFSALNDEFIKCNAVIYGVSRESLKSHENFKAKQKFSFELISDENETLCKLFDVIKAKKLYGKEYIGIVRSTFIINPQGDVLKHWDNVKVKNHAQVVLEFIQAL